jgi:hypothetical protein
MPIARASAVLANAARCNAARPPFRSTLSAFCGHVAASATIASALMCAASYADESSA